MKTLSIINLHKAEIKKSQLSKIKGGGDVKCNCTTGNPFVVTKTQGGTTQLCFCEATTSSTAGVYNSRPD
ncbi:TIGR04149 family rSAM-modified RiPP [Bacteroidota bacterium]